MSAVIQPNFKPPVPIEFKDPLTGHLPSESDAANAQAKQNQQELEKQKADAAAKVQKGLQISAERADKQRLQEAKELASKESPWAFRLQRLQGRIKKLAAEQTPATQPTNQGSDISAPPEGSATHSKGPGVVWYDDDKPGDNKLLNVNKDLESVIKDKPREGATASGIKKDLVSGIQSMGDVYNPLDRAKLPSTIANNPAEGPIALTEWSRPGAKGNGYDNLMSGLQAGADKAANPPYDPVVQDYMQDPTAWHAARERGVQPWDPTPEQPHGELGAGTNVAAHAPPQPELKSITGSMSQPDKDKLTGSNTNREMQASEHEANKKLRAGQSTLNTANKTLEKGNKLINSVKQVHVGPVEYGERGEPMTAEQMQDLPPEIKAEVKTMQEMEASKGKAVGMMIGEGPNAKYQIFNTAGNNPDGSPRMANDKAVPSQVYANLYRSLGKVPTEEEFAQALRTANDPNSKWDGTFVTGRDAINQEIDRAHGVDTEWYKNLFHKNTREGQVVRGHLADNVYVPVVSDAANLAWNFADQINTPGYNGEFKLRDVNWGGAAANFGMGLANGLTLGGLGAGLGATANAARTAWTAGRAAGGTGLYAGAKAIGGQAAKGVGTYFDRQFLAEGTNNLGSGIQQLADNNRLSGMQYDSDNRNARLLSGVSTLAGSGIFNASGRLGKYLERSGAGKGLRTANTVGGPVAGMGVMMGGPMLADAEATENYKNQAALNNYNRSVAYADSNQRPDLINMEAYGNLQNKGLRTSYMSPESAYTQAQERAASMPFWGTNYEQMGGA
jgi:hypothetical protein